MKLWRMRLRSLFCRHLMTLAVQWSPEEACVYAVCQKCDKVFGHFHLPFTAAKYDSKQVRIH